MTINVFIKINGMTCGHCVKAVESELGKLKLISSIVEIGSAKVEYDDSVVNIKKIIEAIKESGYEVLTARN